MLDNALDYDISECDFWSMTFAELDRAVESKKRRDKIKAKEKATHEYILSLLIGRAISNNLSKNATFPEIHEVYPTLFDGEEIKQSKQEKLTNLSVIRFKQFAQSHNSKYGGEKTDE